MLTEEQKKRMRRTIEENRLVGGSSWKTFTRKELEEIYGSLPSWAEEL